jgi:threonine synthase
MKIGLITAFPPERDGVGDYSFHLVNSISEVSADCIFHVIARAAGMAGLSRLKDEGAISRKDSVVVLVTDTGFKHMSAAGSLVNDCPVINPILDDLKSIQAT